ncbi:damage-inducible protein CinA [Vibrio sp. UCD-FRSSP16_10]|uniref:nicotinamide-nucleotide amidase n=1 Tax=unclassified Vibrio TaxID=2614977 RepID=UPI0007FD8FAB|nr:MULTISPECIES: nicotinamide-nucleotide amidase [unclassified Vibrio]OBT17324.1 damage-inducible protein CinA [Vibrio sp. UCD-FRSSP16_30]OBT23093.1 damage-inducible protein CinA [Vibrio sp. UCD-FRSSP16_10]
MSETSLDYLSHQVGKLLKKHGYLMATAESCTGGGVAQAITEIAGSSAWFDRAFITYSNEAKMEMLAVQAQSLQQHGAVSEQVAKEMALGAVKHSRAQIAVSITGIAGPSGGSDDKPVGTVCFGLAVEDGFVQVQRCLFAGDRTQVRNQSVYHALQLIENHINNAN